MDGHVCTYVASSFHEAGKLLLYLRRFGNHLATSDDQIADLASSLQKDCFHDTKIFKREIKQVEPLTKERACAAHILCAITFHFDAARLAFLAEVLRSLSQFSVASMDVVIVTNTSRNDQVTLLHRLSKEVLPGSGAQVRSYEHLSHPFELTWCHKAILGNEFVATNDGRYTHFVYIEDDIRLSFENFRYFVEFRELLRRHGLLPAFVRMEYSAALSGFVASDAFWPIYVPVQAHIRLGDTIMVNMPNPYNPCFILDVELADEYVRSGSFDREASARLCRWGVRERAAMGLCLENVPAPFATRYAVPVSTQTDMVLPVARIAHLPNNYANDPRMPLGKVRIDELFNGARSLIEGGEWWPSRNRGGDGGGGSGSMAKSEFGTNDSVQPATETTSMRSRSGEVTSDDRYYLISHHDTILFVDEAAQRFGHGPFGIAPLNLVLELADLQGRLILLSSDLSKNRRLSFAQPSGETCLSQAFDPDFQVDWFADGSVGLRMNELYIAADLGGIVRNDRSWCRAFEQFRLIRMDTIDGLALLQRHSWISHCDRQIVTLSSQPIDFGRESPHELSALAATLAAGTIELRRDIVFGPARIRLVGRASQLVFDNTNDANPDAPLNVFITDATGRRYGFSRLQSERNIG